MSWKGVRNGKIKIAGGYPLKGTFVSVVQKIVRLPLFLQQF